MISIRSVATVLGFAAVTTLGTLTVFWPKTTLADGDDTAAELTLDGTRVKDDVVVTGDLVKDPKAKSGWIMQVEIENRGTHEATAQLETDLTRQVSSPVSRAAPMPTAMLKKKESVTLAAGEKVTKRYEIPAWIAQQVAAAKRAEAARDKAIEAGKAVDLSRPATYFAVAFKGPWANEYNEWPPSPLPAPLKPAPQQRAVAARL